MENGMRSHLSLTWLHATMGSATRDCSCTWNGRDVLAVTRRSHPALVHVIIAVVNLMNPTLRLDRRSPLRNTSSMPSLPRKGTMHDWRRWRWWGRPRR